MIDRHIDEQGWEYEDRPNGRRHYVNSPALQEAREKAREAEKIDKNLRDAYAAATEPALTAQLKELSINASLALDGAKAAVNREKFRLMQRESEYGYLDENGDRRPYGATKPDTTADDGEEDIDNLREQIRHDEVNHEAQERPTAKLGIQRSPNHDIYDINGHTKTWVLGLQRTERPAALEPIAILTEPIMIQLLTLIIDRLTQAAHEEEA